MLGEEIVGQFFSLLEAVDAVGDSKVHPLVANILHEVVFVDEFMRDDIEFDSAIFWAIERSIQIVVGDIDSHELCIGTGTDTVEDTFDNFE